MQSEVISFVWIYYMSVKYYYFVVVVQYCVVCDCLEKK